MSGEVRSVEPRKKQKRQGEWERESVCLFCVARESQSVREGRKEGGREGGKRVEGDGDRESEGHGDKMKEKVHGRR